MFRVKYFFTSFRDNLRVNKFAERLKEARLEMGLSRRELAARCGTIERNLSYWELGRRECDFDMLIKLATALDVSVDYLIGKTDF